MRLLNKSWRLGLIGSVLGLLVSLCLFGPDLFEPTEKPRFEDVTIVSYRMSFHTQRFKVVSTKTGQSWQVGAARGPYSSDYRGPAILSLSRGQWTGKDHLRLVERGSVTNRPDKALPAAAAQPGS
jgi:hypothetical protein